MTDKNAYADGHRDRASVRREVRTDICVTVEVREDAVTRRMRIVAPSIERAMKVAGDEKLGRRVRLLFPIDPEIFFVPEDRDRREAA
jgi:hypothetical protein